MASDKFFIVLSHGMDNPNRASRALQLTKVAHEKGREVQLFLMDDGVNIAREGIVNTIKSAAGDEAKDHMDYLIKNNIPILVCKPCAASRQIVPEEMVPNATLATGADLIDIASVSTTLSF
jgi:predicted peroxiredoxin